MPVAAIGDRLRLAPHVRACRSDDQVILLDLQRGHYLGISPQQADALTGQVDDWPASLERMGSAAPIPAAEGLKRHLLSRGLLIPTSSDAAQQTTIPESTSTLPVDVEAARSAVTALRLARLLRCTAVTALWMRYRSLQSIAMAVAARRDRHQADTTSQSSLDLTRDAVAAYDRLRPLALTKHNRCVHDSLTLMAFLALEGVFPHWVIGVKTGPFGAHSWVQSGSIVLNDLHENVRRYRPILVV